MTDWLHEALVELQHREDSYRKRDDEAEYWSNVANGISEAIDVLEEADQKRAAERVEE